MLPRFEFRNGIIDMDWQIKTLDAQNARRTIEGKRGNEPAKYLKVTGVIFGAYLLYFVISMFVLNQWFGKF